MAVTAQISDLVALDQLQLSGPSEGPPEAIEAFSVTGTAIVRSVVRRQSGKTESSLPLSAEAERVEQDLARRYDWEWLRAVERPKVLRSRELITAVDLFAGCGGLTLGAWEAARALGAELRPLFAVDVDADALATFGRNFPSAELSSAPIESLLDGRLGARPTLAERRLKAKLGTVNLALAGPPCQGHSDLNNHTRRDDPKNALYLRVARFAEVFEPPHLIVENVPGVVHDKNNVVGETWRILRALGYHVEGRVLVASDLGVAQRRRRFFTVATAGPFAGLEAISARHRQEERPVLWACGDLERSIGDTTFDTAASHSIENRRRIDFLFANGLFDLPDAERPDCHRLKPHSYKAVYGRLHSDRAAPTITSGFGSTGQGRFVHPNQPRTLTPHEAARVQFFPDFFDFGTTFRRSYQRMIGNAVPPKLAYVVALELLR
jgi:DNA (cytosine-5)-methyltransferase 1